MDRLRRTLGYEVAAVAEHVQVAQRLQAQKLRLNALDAHIEAQNAAPRYRGPERRRVPR